MTLQETKKLAGHIFRLLKVSEIVLPIGRTNKGNLGLKFSENSSDFELYLDAVPLSTKDSLVDDNNIELKKMVEKYLFEQPQTIYKELQPGFTTMESIKPILPIDFQDKPKRGRPIGSKNAHNKTKKSS